MIVNYVSRAMGERRLTIAEVARRTGLAYSTVHDLYHGRAKRIEFATLDKVCTALRVESIVEVLGYLPEDRERRATEAGAGAGEETS
jgi:putative transcriptional regulator